VTGGLKKDELPLVLARYTTAFAATAGESTQEIIAQVASALSHSFPKPAPNQMVLGRWLKKRI